ncbi:TonB-dependent receptor plug domain-containing protein [Luteimonas saliphila]|uniref:TonB-dependent receptor plug domain-containing protein n=1 Tax=Luteimonas saliphila TaxID=2804919 RepID=UPI00192D465B|nr:TonB-dependent receptor [Luteimonas saliphila]
MKTSSLYGAMGVALFASVGGTAGSAAAQQPVKEQQASAVTEDERSAEASQPSTAIELEQITVTGTRIRGGTSPSPVITIGAEHIREEGFTDLGEVIRSVPQNFGGGQNPEVPSANLLGAGLANQNLTGGSGLNLRGLGPDASLTLLNGRRLAYDGFSQAIDIGAIPVEAVDRVEIVADGASAIYGSDAVGGVANVILRRGLEGVAVGTRYGTATGGGLTTRSHTVTAGASWSSGGLLATYKDETVDPIYADERSYTAPLAAPRTIYSASDLRSSLVSVHQQAGEFAELRLDAFRSTRGQHNEFVLAAFAPYYRLAPETTVDWISPGIDLFLPRDWTLTVGGAWGRNESVSSQSLIDPSSGTSTRLYSECYCNEGRSYELGVEGPLFHLPGGEARLAAGAGRRTNQLHVDNYLADVNGLPSYQGAESSRFAYAEVQLPWMENAAGSGNPQRLVTTLAARSEDYDSFGRVTTPQVGVIYGPSPDVTLKASWGRSFKAPTLYQGYYYVTALLYPAAALGGAGYPPDATAIYLVGGDRNLSPERARTWTASLAFHPQALPGLETELTWFDIDYEDRVVQPFANAAQGLSNPVYAPFVDYAPSAGEQAGAIGSAGSFLNYSGATYDPDNVVAILRGRFVNVSRQRVEGLDLSASYRIDAGAGRLTLRGSATWLDSTQQLAPGQADTRLAGTLYNPAKVNGRLGIVWNRGNFTASTFANYTSGVDDTVNDEQGASFSTFDATLRYAIDRNQTHWPGFEIALSAQNLFNRAPPLHTPAPQVYALPYDPTNYSAVGRFLALSASLRW